MKQEGKWTTLEENPLKRIILNRIIPIFILHVRIDRIFPTRYESSLLKKMEKRDGDSGM